MTVNNDDPNVQRTSSAVRALEAYEQNEFPGEQSALGDPEYNQALVSALLCDLEHLAAAQGLDFTEAVAAGHKTYTDEIAGQARYELGDEVRIRRAPERCGTITGIKSANGVPSYVVSVPGQGYLHEEPAAHLEPAPPFPPTRAAGSLVRGAAQAEDAIVELSAIIDLAGADNPAVDKIKHERGNLIGVLSGWSGCPTLDVLKTLNSKVLNRLDDLFLPDRDPAAPIEPAEAVKLAAADFPYDIGNGIPTGTPEPVPRQPRPGPGLGPGRTP